MKTLEQYLKENLDQKTLDHTIRASYSDGLVTFYIHPSNTDGDTLDFVVKDNDLIPAQHQQPDGTILIEYKLPN